MGARYCSALWWARSPELLCFSSRSGDRWLSGGSRAGCGGLAILTGVFLRIGAACIRVVMIGAISLVHIARGFDVAKGGFEYAFVQLVIAFSLFLTGPGVYSLAGILPPPLRKF